MRSALANASGGSIEAIEDAVTAASIRDVARLEGIYPETAGGVTLAAAAAARRRGVIRHGDEVVALLTGTGSRHPTRGRWGAPTVPRGRVSPVSRRRSGRACRVRALAGGRA